ncbi:ABC transporter permease [Cellulomonas sp. H30R-01]|uniref:ABC transporter permease n=1 Tax=Cellulomonas sp. H30R-01 TaxID=2704467 RepID=UPI00138DAB98|nr:ABC transporter permease [Cellulomonas sp. H30R-01]QHT57132.1 ABC transporter permease [Cellulomonas sp. H30R-01]
MSTTTTAPARAVAPRRPSAARALRRLTLTEGRLFLRDPSNAFFAIAFPGLLLMVLGLVMPWADQPFDVDDPILSQFTAITGYTPTVLALAIGTVAFTTFPTTIATYRQRGVLRRLSTTPVPPTRVLVAQVAVNLAALLVAALLAFVLGVVVVGVEAPEQPVLVVGAFVLSVLAAFAVGSLVAAVAPTGPAANGIGATVYFLSLFFAGVWLPLPLMPDVVQTIAQWTPLGAAAQAMSAAWFGQPFPGVELLALAVWALVGIPLAARLFRWS